MDLHKWCVRCADALVDDLDGFGRSKAVQARGPLTIFRHQMEFATETEGRAFMYDVSQIQQDGKLI